MVKSKKMSKSTVAIVLLSLLLVLSLILTATGAWFTSTAPADSASSNFKYGTVSGTITAGTNVKHYDATYTTGTGDAADSIERQEVLPGDWLVTSVTIKNTSDVDVYYAIKKGSDYYYINGKTLTAYGEATEAQKIAEDAEALSAYFELHIETSVVYDDAHVAGQEVSFGGESFTVIFIQADNITAAQALLQLKTM